MSSDYIQIYTDGACSGNPGPGGWGAIILEKNNSKEISGFEKNTTNNRMELIAVIESLKVIQPNCRIQIFTDSNYVMTGIKEWIHKWKKNNWITASKKPVKNVDLWKILDELCNEKEIEWFWVKGHSGNKGNERADFLARESIKKMSR